MSKQLELIAHDVLIKYPVKRVALFGSAARGETTETSDIDMLVEFLPNTRGLDFFWLRLDLEEALGYPVDLLTPALGRMLKVKQG